MALDMAKFLARFVEEAREHVNKLNDGLVILEKNPDDYENLNAVFRSAHTIKGSSKMMKLNAITEVAHKMEDALGALRDKRIRHSKELSDLIFQGIDVVSSLIDKAAAGQELAIDTSQLCAELAKAAEGDPSPTEPMDNKGDGKGVTELNETVLLEKPSPVAEIPPPTPPPVEKEISLKELKPKHIETIRINAEKLDDLIKLMGEIVSNQNRLKQRLADAKEVERWAKRSMELMSKVQTDNKGFTPFAQKIVEEPFSEEAFSSRYPQSELISLHEVPSDQQRTAAPSGFHKMEQLTFSEEMLYVGQNLFQKLKDLVSAIRDDAAMQELLTAELQEKALMMRMVPLSTIFDSLTRMVRDMSKSLGKDIDLVIEGGDIELDRKMVEKVGDPLIHMIRNAIDHGIESPEERARFGKSARGIVKISACYDAGSVLIAISDDGYGIPLAKIKEKALRKKIYDEEDFNKISEATLIDLIFQPGFSTSAIITDISGRGVGMDVVKRNIVEELRGSISVETKETKGTTFYIRLPLTLAVMRVLLLTVAGNTYAITTHYIGEIIRIDATKLINVVDKRAIRLREELIPVVVLENLLQLSEEEPASGVGFLIIIVQMGHEKLGLIVDALIDEEDMVIKSLPSHMRKIQLVSGVTISGKNEIINVLHIPAIMEAAKEMKESRLFSGAAQEGKDLGMTRILVVDDSINTREIEKSILETHGYKVDLASDGLEALEKVREVQYDAVITDVEMPRLDGFALTESLRKESAYMDVPIIIVTSREKEEDKRKGIQVGADAYIIKGSFDQSNLLETLRNLVG